MTTGNLTDKTVVIIGGTAGIGLATVVAASEAGAKVWVAGRSQTNLDKARSVARRISLP